MSVVRPLLAVVVLALFAAGVWRYGRPSTTAADTPAPEAAPVVAVQPVDDEPRDDPAPVQTTTPAPPADAPVPAPADIAADQPARLVRGRVTRVADASPIPGARVTVTRDDERLARTTTDADGRWSATVAAAPDEVLALDVAWSARGREHRARRELSSPTTDVAFDTGWTLALRVFDPYGLATTTGRVALVDGADEPIADVTPRDGAWIARDLPVVSTAAVWRLVARVPGAQVHVETLTPPVTTERRELTLLLEPAGAIAASIRTSDGRPAAGARLEIADDDRGAPIDLDLGATTDDAGRARLEHVAPPSAVATGTWTDPRDDTTHRFHGELAVRPGDTTRWDHVIGPGAAITGRIVTISGVARPDVEVDVLAALSPVAAPLDATDTTDAEGRFAVTGLAPGPKRLVVRDAGEVAATRQLDLPREGLDDVVIPYGGRVYHAVTTTDAAGAPLPRTDVTLLATPADEPPGLAQDWVGVTAGLPYDHPDAPVFDTRVITGFQYVGQMPFRQTRVEYSRPKEAPPPGLEGPSTRTLEPPVDIALSAYFQPLVQPHARSGDDGRITITIDANLGTIDVGEVRLPSVPFAELSSTDDAPLDGVLADWVLGDVDLWVVASRAGWVTSAVPIEPATSTSRLVRLAPAPQLVVRVRDTFGTRRHDVHAELVDPTTGARVVVDTEPLGPAAFVVFTDRAGDGRVLELTVEAPDDLPSTLSWTPGPAGSLDDVDVELTPRDAER